jgi:phosphoglycolate phosphatase
MPDVCVFDLDHTLVRSPLDLGAARREVRALATAGGLALPPASIAWTIAQTIDALGAADPDLARRAWTLVLDHETRALDGVACEPGAREAVDALRAAGFALAVWTNNARAATETALRRCGLAAYFPTLVTRDEAALKPDPEGLRLLRATYPAHRFWVIGDSWIDGAAAQAGGAAFIAYGITVDELARRRVTARAAIDDLRALPQWLLAARDRASGAHRVDSPKPEASETRRV